MRGSRSGAARPRRRRRAAHDAVAPERPPNYSCVVDKLKNINQQPPSDYRNSSSWNRPVFTSLIYDVHANERLNQKYDYLGPEHTCTDGVSRSTMTC